jgi:hypothetical protein
MGLRSRFRALAHAVRRRTWRVGITHRNPPLIAPNRGRVDAVIVVLGMHRSGTSAVVGLIEDQGLSSGAELRHGVADNVLGTRENPELVSLDEELLRFNGASWIEPPVSSLKYTSTHVHRRNAVLTSYERRVLKDPRMLLLGEFWKDESLRMIGVLRNPLAVSCSLRRRDPSLSHERCRELWIAYNEGMLDLLKWKAFPVVVFEDRVPIETQVANALSFHGVSARNPFRSFYADAVRGAGGETAWQHRSSRDMAELWDEILSLAVPVS